MSIIVENLTKSYGPQKAIDEISFSANKGQILGFLGPNGAGKTTTMKILTCYMPQTSGTAKVCGLDVVTESFAVRQKIGYLAEHNPLYLDMYVKEYLKMVAGFHKIKNSKKRVDEMIDFTGLSREQHKKIGALSKGYRQRVGLAQAMFHDPEVLVLDEPTSGLDPNQLKEIRALIKSLGEEKTVILSTHIMQEVQMLCDRVIIIDQGKIVADDPIDSLANRVSSSSVVYVEFEDACPVNLLSDINGVDNVKKITDRKFEVYSTGSEDLRKSIFNKAVKNSKVILEMRMEDLSVEDVFQKLTNN